MVRGNVSWAGGRRNELAFARGTRTRKVRRVWALLKIWVGQQPLDRILQAAKDWPLSGCSLKLRTAGRIHCGIWNQPWILEFHILDAVEKHRAAVASNDFTNR